MTALNIKIGEISDAEVKREFETARDQILSGARMNATEKTYGLIRLLIEVQPGETSVISFLTNLQKSQQAQQAAQPPPRTPPAP